MALPNGVAVNSQGGDSEPVNLMDYSTWPAPVQIGVPALGAAGLLGFVGWWWMRRRRPAVAPRLTHGPVRPALTPSAG